MKILATISKNIYLYKHGAKKNLDFIGFYRKFLYLENRYNFSGGETAKIGELIQIKYCVG